MLSSATLLEIGLSAAVILAVGYHAVLTMNQKLSYFHSVRYLLFTSYLLFGGVVASELGLVLASDASTASSLLRTEITLVAMASVSLGVAANVLALQARGEEFPYKAIIKKPPLSLIFNFITGVSIPTLVWFVFDFEFEVGEKALLGTQAFIPRLDTLQIATLSLIFLGFVWNQSKLTSRDASASRPISLFKVTRATGLLWIIIAGILFTFNGALRTIGVDMVVFGHLIDSVVLTYVAYIYAKPTALLEFFASDSPLACRLKQKEFSGVFNPLSSRLNLPHAELRGKRLFLLAEIRQNQVTLEGFLNEAVANSHRAIVISHAAHSPSTRNGVTNIAMSLESKSPSVGEEQIIIPLNRRDQALDIIRKALNIRRDLWVAFPNMSALIAHWGFVPTFEFLQHLSELLGEEGVSLCVLFPSMHDHQDIEKIWLLGQPLAERGGKIYYLRSLDTGSSEVPEQSDLLRVG